MHKKEPTYALIRQHIEKLIAQNQNAQNYKLPSENQLAMLFKTSRVPVKRALDDLEREGLIYRRQGKGSFIAGKNGLRKEPLRIGVIVPRMGIAVYGALLRGISQVLNDKEVLFYTMVSDDDVDKEEGYINDCMQRHFDGMLIFPAVSHTYSSALLRIVLKRYPAVLAGRSFPGLNISFVCGNHYDQCYHMVEELIQLGHEHIAYIGEDGYSSPPYQERIQGYTTCMLEHFSNDHVNVRTVDFFNRSDDIDARTVAALEEVLKKPVSALILTNNALDPVLNYLETHDRTDMQLGLFDYPLNQKVLRSAVAQRSVFVCQDFYEVGVRAARQLLTQIEDHSAPAQITLDTVLYRNVSELERHIFHNTVSF